MESQDQHGVTLLLHGYPSTKPASGEEVLAASWEAGLEPFQLRLTGIEIGKHGLSLCWWAAMEDGQLERHCLGQYS